MFKQAFLYTVYFDNLQEYNNTMIGDAANKNYWGIQLPKPTIGYAKNISIKNNIAANTDAGWIVQANAPVVIDNLDISYNKAPLWVLCFFIVNVEIIA